MRAETRRRFFVLCGIALFGRFLAAVRNLAPFGHYRGLMGMCSIELRIFLRKCAPPWNHG